MLTPQLTTIISITISSLIAVTGWVVVYRLNVKAQRKQFINSVRNEARRDIVRAIRQEQEWLSKVSVQLFALKFPASSVDGGADQIWTEKCTATETALRSDRGEVLITLEEYETLFPHTRVCRGELSKLLFSYGADASNIARDVRDPKTRSQALRDANHLAEERSKEIAMLLEDLRVHIQNVALGEITGHKVIQKRPARFDKLPRLLPGDDGQLRVTKVEGL
jgi:hypothetical protein